MRTEIIEKLINENKETKVQIKEEKVKVNVKIIKELDYKIRVFVARQKMKNRRYSLQKFFEEAIVQKLRQEEGK